MARVLVVTTSMGTKWESYSQALVKRHVPEWPRMIIDGRKNWSPTGFIDKVIHEDADYLVHIDEDCFVESRSSLLNLIERFEQNHDFVAAGIPDGGHLYRQHNPAALNLFFVVFRMNALRKAWDRNNLWAGFTFQSEFSADVIRQCPDLDMAQVRWDEAEPYYPLFWSLLSAGGRFLYLTQRLNQTRWSTQILAPSGAQIGEHLWYLRQWFSASTMQGHDRPNVSRYQDFESELLKRESNLGFRATVALLNAKRYIRRVLS